jgi:hypothetical protein
VSKDAGLDVFVQRRRLALYEQSVARHGYAYGVGVRRSRWLARSAIGNLAVRAVDRSWSGLASELSDELELPDGELEPALLNELELLREILRSPTPALRVLRQPSPASSWSLATPLGTPRGDVRWLVIDEHRLREHPPHVRRFALASGLAHLQCDQTIYFTAQMMVSRRRANRAISALDRLVRPWSKLLAFSADRAGLLVGDGLTETIDALRIVAELDAEVPWWPSPAPLELRIDALREFERSAVVARVRAAREHARASSALLGDASDLPHVPDDAWSLARCDRRLTERLGLI